MATSANEAAPAQPSSNDQFYAKYGGWLFLIMLLLCPIFAYAWYIQLAELTPEWRSISNHDLAIITGAYVILTLLVLFTWRSCKKYVAKLS